MTRSEMSRLRSDSTTAVSRCFQEPIVALRQQDSGREIALAPAERVNIGSHPGCDIVVDDPYVSSRHCVLERRSRKQIFVRDEWSKNGTFVNGNRVELAEVRPGAMLRLGTTTFLALGHRGRRRLSAFEHLRGSDPAFCHAVETAMKAAITDCSILVLGETGTGKELIARAVHEGSPRSTGPLVAVNCGAISSELIGSELFGHERGAFTGALAARDGMFVQANGGTLFLDELGELPTEQQPHLLRVLETRTVRRIGSNREYPVDVRLVAATNRIHGLGTGASLLRLDLYHRVATVVVELPPLRQRPADIPELVHAFMDEFAYVYGPRYLARTTLRALCQHPWPGNVRELRCAIQRAMTLCPRELTLEHLLPRTGFSLSPAALPHPLEGPMRAREPGARIAMDSDGRPLKPFDLMLRDQMLDALERSGSIRRAADSLGMAKSTFADRARRLGIFS